MGCNESKEWDPNYYEFSYAVEKMNDVKDDKAKREALEALAKFKELHTRNPGVVFPRGVTGAVLLCQQCNKSEVVKEAIEWLVTNAGPEASFNVASDDGTFGPYYALLELVEKSPPDFTIKILKLFQEGKNTCAPLDPNVDSLTGQTAARIAISNESQSIGDKETAEILEILCALGAKILPYGTYIYPFKNEKWPGGRAELKDATLLHFCVAEDKPLSAKVCLEQGVDREVKSQNPEQPWTALEFAKASKEPNAELIAILEA